MPGQVERCRIWIQVFWVKNPDSTFIITLPFIRLKSYISWAIIMYLPPSHMLSQWLQQTRWVSCSHFKAGWGDHRNEAVCVCSRPRVQIQVFCHRAPATTPPKPQGLTSVEQAFWAALTMLSSHTLAFWFEIFQAYRDVERIRQWISDYPSTRFKNYCWASLVAQWLRICLPMQGARVQALVREDPTCRGATGPVSHNYWACASGACAPQQERPR